MSQSLPSVYSLDLFMFSRLLLLVLECIVPDVNKLHPRGGSMVFVQEDVLVYILEVSQVFTDRLSYILTIGY